MKYEQFAYPLLGGVVLGALLAKIQTGIHRAYQTSTGKDKYGIAKIFPDFGKKWFNKWDNGHARTLKPDNWDPDDSNFGFHLPTSQNLKLVIDGKGKASLPANMIGDDSQRLFVNGPWLNTEMTVYIRWRTRIWNTFQMRARSNHHGTKNLPYGYNTKLKASCGFGNYEAIWSSGRGRNSVEVIHDLYSPTVSGGNSPIPAENIWIGHKFITRTVTGSNAVKCEAWTNTSLTDQTTWNKDTEFTYTGKNTHIDSSIMQAKVNYCLDKGDKIAGELDKNTLWLNPGKWSWLRFNGGDDIDIRYFSVREIAPLP